MSQPSQEYNPLFGDAEFLAVVDNFKANQARLIGQQLPRSGAESAEWEADYQKIVTELDDAQPPFDGLFDYPSAPFEDSLPDVETTFNYPEPRWGARLTVAPREENPTTDELGRPYLVRDAASYGRYMWESTFAPFDAPKIDGRKVLASAAAATVLLTGIMADKQPDSSYEVAQPAMPTTPVVYKTPTNTIVEIGDLRNQDIEQSMVDAANASAIPPEDQALKDSTLVLPREVTTDQVSAAYMAFMAPEATASEDGSTASTTSVPEAEKLQIPAEVAALNNALAKVDINATTIDISEVVEAAKAVDRWYAPQDKDRRTEMPVGYVKLLLPSEATGLEVPMTVAQRTADNERYTSPQMAAVQYVTAKMYQDLIKTKYPQMEGEMFRVRDNNSPIHKTHNDGRNADMAGAFGWEVEQYSDGGFADYQFSGRFNQQFTTDMAVLMSRLSVGGERVISSILSSGNSMVPDINNAVGFRFMIDHDENHQDHFHVTVDKKYALPNWRVRAGDLQWSVDQDLRIAGMAQDISPEQHASQHADHEAWVRDNHGDEHTDTVPAPTPEAPKIIEPETLTPEAAQLIDELDLPEGHKDFLRVMLPSIMANYHAGARINPAVVLAQTSLETGFGNDTLSKAANNYFGMKAGKKWDGPVYNANTKEEYTAGEVVTITDGFRAYTNPAESVADYAKLIQGAPHYADAVQNYQSIPGYANGLFNEVDANGNIVKEQGDPGVLSYGTDRGYEQKIFRAIEQYNYQALVDAQDTKSEKIEQTEQTTIPTTTFPKATTSTTGTSASTTTLPANAEVVEINEFNWFSLDSARHIYEPYFRGSDGQVDLAALGEWVDSLPQKVDSQGQVSYQISIDNTPEKAEGDK